jgi:hypothetical protein
MKRQKCVTFEYDKLQSCSRSETETSSDRDLYSFNQDQTNEDQTESRSDYDSEYDIDILLSDMIMSILEELQEVIDQNVGTLW